MIVRAISKYGRDLPEDCKDARMGFDDATEFPVVIGKEYVVYAMTVVLNHPWYYICDEVGLPFPVFKPAPLFEVVDGHISQYWEYGYLRSKHQEPAYAIFAFSEWARDLYFYDRLTDQDETTIATIRRYKHLIEEEAQMGGSR
jgi:hypothetical protein